MSVNKLPCSKKKKKNAFRRPAGKERIKSQLSLHLGLQGLSGVTAQATSGLSSALTSTLPLLTIGSVKLSVTLGHCSPGSHLNAWSPPWCSKPLQTVSQGQ